MAHDISISRFDKKVGDIGTGVTGKVTLFKTRHELLYAVKTYTNKEKYETFQEYKTRVAYEYKVIRKLEHINIIKAYIFRSSFFNNNVYLCLEYGGKTFTSIMKQINPKPSELLCFWKQTVLGLDYLHKKNIYHRDLKFDNILITVNGIVKLIDFMDSTQSIDCYGIVGTDKFIAPEVFTQLSYRGDTMDIWSMGIILYYIIFKRYIWKMAKVEYEPFESYLNSTKLALDPQTPDHIKVCLTNMLKVDPHLRWSMQDLTNFVWIKNLSSCTEGNCKYKHAL